jgi:hypothetical protein
MNNGIQQPMPQVRTVPSNNAVPSNNMNQNIQNLPKVSSPQSIEKSELEKVVLEAVAKNNNIVSNNNLQSNKKNNNNGLYILPENIEKEILFGEKIIASSISSAFALVVALAWNKAITEYLQKYIRFSEGSKYTLFYYALLITLLYIIYVRVFRKYIVN